MVVEGLPSPANFAVTLNCRMGNAERWTRRSRALPTPDVLQFNTLAGRRPISRSTSHSVSSLVWFCQSVSGCLFRGEVFGDYLRHLVCFPKPAASCLSCPTMTAGSRSTNEGLLQPNTSMEGARRTQLSGLFTSERPGLPSPAGPGSPGRNRGRLTVGLSQSAAVLLDRKSGCPRVGHQPVHVLPPFLQPFPLKRAFRDKQIR